MCGAFIRQGLGMHIIRDERSRMSDGYNRLLSRGGRKKRGNRKKKAGAVQQWSARSCTPYGFLPLLFRTLRLNTTVPYNIQQTSRLLVVHQQLADRRLASFILLLLWNYCRRRLISCASLYLVPTLPPAIMVIIN